MPDSEHRLFWIGGVLGVGLSLLPLVGWAQEGAAVAKPGKGRVVRKRLPPRPNPDQPSSAPSDADLPLGVQESLGEVKRLQEQYRREAAARRRAEAEARRKGLPWLPPEESTLEESLPELPTAPEQMVSQPMPPPAESQPPPQNGNSNGNATGSQASPPPQPADGKTVIRTWPRPKKPASPNALQ